MQVKTVKYISLNSITHYYFIGIALHKGRCSAWWFHCTHG